MTGDQLPLNPGWGTAERHPGGRPRLHRRQAIMVVWVRDFADTIGGLVGFPSRFSSWSMAPVASQKPAVLALSWALRRTRRSLPVMRKRRSSPADSPPVGPDDIGFGAGYFPKARLRATMSPPNSGRDAQLTGYKLPPVVYPGATVTMTIAPSARSYVVQQNPWSSRQGSVSVTYRACLHKPGFFPQSFRFTDGRKRGCVPLDVRVGRQRKTSHIVLSFFAGRCRTSS